MLIFENSRFCLNISKTNLLNLHKIYDFLSPPDFPFIFLPSPQRLAKTSVYDTIQVPLAEISQKVGKQQFAETKNKTTHVDCLINCSVLFCNPEFEPKRWEGVVKDFGQTESVRLGVILRTKLQTLSNIRFIVRQSSIPHSGKVPRRCANRLAQTL